ncbi:MAG: Hpt domain-containing protein [Pseudomonadota bacterium]|nr:Hpt domain-containing protein [Pseudomonadota bacterium]
MTAPVIDPHTFDELQATAGADFVAELRAAGADGDAEHFRRAAHSLKSNSSTFGASRLAGLARDLELGGLPADHVGVDALEREVQTALAALQTLARP